MMPLLHNKHRETTWVMLTIMHNKRIELLHYFAACNGSLHGLTHDLQSC